MNLLTKAQVPNSPEHNQILQHLESVRNTAAASRAVPHPQRTKPVLPSEPLLVNVAKRGEPPQYTSNILPRPKDSLAGPRKVPSVSATADGQPFVRLRKPQPHALSRMIGRKGKIFSNRIINIKDIDERVVPEALLEDEWDRMMDRLLLLEKEDGSSSSSTRKPQRERESSTGEESSGVHPKMETYSWSVQLSRLWWEWKVEQTWEDWIARGDALHELVEQERALAERESSSSKKRSSSSSSRRTTTTPRRSALDIDDSPPNVGVSAAPPLAVLAAARSDVPPSWDVTKDKEEDANDDPFLSPEWATLVKAQQARMLRWAGRRVDGQRYD